MDERFDTDKYWAVHAYMERVRAPRRILEIGVKNGGSLLLWCDLWPSVEHVIGVDKESPLEGLHDKIRVLQADQADAPALREIASSHGPFDLVIDDASHLGEASWITFQALWPFVTPGGIYVVEDWETGYWDEWPDGIEYRDVPAPGHAAGMVGMIKRLVDQIGRGEVERLDLLAGGLGFAFKQSKPLSPPESR